MSAMKPETKEHWARAVVIAALILFAAAIRLVPHPWNMTPVGAMALFSGAIIRKRWLAFLFPLVAMAAGDTMIGFHKLIPVVYASFLISVAIGFWLRDNRTVLCLGGAVFLGALQFFLITNLGVWAFLGSYARTAAGLAACYATGLPLFWNTLAGDVLYSGILFGALYLSEVTYPALRPGASAAA